MGTLRQTGMKWVLMSAYLGFAGTAFAACTGPQAMLARLRAHPTTDNAVILGSWYAGHQQFGCAADTFRAALKGDPNSAQLHYLTGLALLGARNVPDAVPEIKESIRLEPQVIKPHLMLASLYDEAGKHADAEEQWKLALGIDPHSLPALEGLSTDLLVRQDNVGVIKQLHDVPLNDKLSITLSRALGLLNYLDEANAVLTEALQKSPDSVPLASALTVVLVKQVKYQEAINLLQHVVEKNPGNQEAELQFFRILVLTNHINLARPIGPKLLAKRPHDPEVLYLNGIVERSVGDYATAKTHLEQAVAADPNFFNSRYNLGMVLVFLKEWQGAKEQLQKAIDLGATEPQVHFEMAKALRGLGETDRALEEMKLYQQIKKTEEKTLEAAESAAQGDTELKAGKFTEAIVHYREAAEGEPTSAGYKYKLSIALLQAGDVAGERAQLEEAVKLDPKLAGAQIELGYALSRSGDAAGAVQHFRMAVEAAPGWAEAWINLAAELAVDAHFQEAREAVAKALALDPGNAQARELRDQLARDPAAQQDHP